jgi:hypothetical protein
MLVHSFGSLIVCGRWLSITNVSVESYSYRFEEISYCFDILFLIAKNQYLHQGEVFFHSFKKRTFLISTISNWKKVLFIQIEIGEYFIKRTIHKTLCMFFIYNIIRDLFFDKCIGDKGFVNHI